MELKFQKAVCDEAPFENGGWIIEVGAY